MTSPSGLILTRLNSSVFAPSVLYSQNLALYLYQRYPCRSIRTGGRANQRRGEQGSQELEDAVDHHDRYPLPSPFFSISAVSCR
jgi:hypothetical protein